VEAERPRLPGRIRAVEVASGKINGSQGQTFTAGKLGSFTVGADKTILLGPPFVFTSANINQFNF
jgi:rhamnose transport system substrate-binding protein